MLPAEVIQYLSSHFKWIGESKQVNVLHWSCVWINSFSILTCSCIFSQWADRWTFIKNKCFVRLAGSTSSCSPEGLHSWIVLLCRDPGRVLGTCVITPWNLLGLSPSPCQEVSVYVLMSLTALLAEEHLVEHCGWHLSAKLQTCLNLKCAEEHDLSLFLLFFKEMKRISLLGFSCMAGVFSPHRLHRAVSLLPSRTGGLSSSLWCFARLLVCHFLLPSISIFDRLFFFFLLWGM